MKKYFIKYKLLSVLLACIMVTSGIMTYNAYSDNKGYTITSQITDPSGSNPTIHPGEEFEVTYTITPDDIPCKSIDKDIMFVLDTSGSMKDDINGRYSGSKLKLIKDASNNFIDKFKVNDGEKINIGIVQYSTYAAKVADLKNISEVNNKEMLKGVIGRTDAEGFKASGGTNIGDALRSGYYTLKDSTNNAKGKYMILMTDGKPSSYSYIKSGNSKENYLGKYISSTLELRDNYPINSTGNKDEYAIRNNNKDEYYVTSGTQEETEDENYVSDVIDLVNQYNSNNLDSPIQTFILGIAGSNVNYVNGIADKLGGKAFFASTAAEIDKIYNEIQSIIEKDLSSSITFTDEVIQDLEIAADANELQSIMVKQDGKIINYKKDQLGNKLSINAGFNYNQSINEEGKKVYSATPIEIIIRYKAMASGEFVMNKGKVEVDIPNKGSSPSDIPPITIRVKDWTGASIPVNIEVADSFGVLTNKYNSYDQKPLLNRYDKYVVNDNTNESFRMFGKSTAILKVEKTEEFEKLEYQILRFDTSQMNIEMPMDGWNIIERPIEGNTYTKEFIFGENVGVYYIAYQCLSGTKSLKSGIYGPFIIEDKVQVNRVFSKENIIPNENIDLSYRITPKEIDSKEIVKATGVTAPKEVYINNFIIKDVIPSGLDLVLKPNDSIDFIGNVELQTNNNVITLILKNPVKYVLNDNDIYMAEPIVISLTGTSNSEKNYTLPSENCSYEYMSIVKDAEAKDIPLILCHPTDDVSLKVMVNRDTQILGHSIYLNNDKGLLMKLENEEGVNISKHVPATIGIVVNINNGESNNYPTRVRVTNNNSVSISVENPNVYKLNVDGTIGNSVPFSVNKNNWIQFDTTKGISQYVIVYQYTPTSDITLYANMQRKIGGSFDKDNTYKMEFKLKMDSDEMPNLF